MLRTDDDTDDLLSRAAAGSSAAANELFERHRERLVNMIRARIDRRILARVDPSDVVQNSLVEAHAKLPAFAATRPIPVYPWLRSIAWDQLIQVHRRHLNADCRSVRREESFLALPNHSEILLAERLAASATNPSRRALREELRERVRAAIRQLSPSDREVVVLRHLEELPFKEITAVLGMSEAAVYSRYRRAMEQLARLLKTDS